MRARGLVAGFLLATLALFLLTRGQFGFGARNSTSSLDDVSATEVLAHLRFLSDDLLEGRGPSTRGGELAARYLAAQLALLGYTPAGDNGTYFQRVPVLESILDPSSNVHLNDGTLLKFSSEIMASSGLVAPRVDVAGSVVFVGYGIVAPEYGWDDYAGADVAGKIALVMVNEPRATASQPQMFGADALTYYGRWTYKFEEAARHGAAGVLLIHTDESATYPWQVVQASWSGPRSSLPPKAGDPALSLKAWVTESTARMIVGKAGRDLDELTRAANSRGAGAVPLDVRLSATLVRTIQEKASPNVVGLLQGRDQGQGVLLTAHYDHLGVRTAEPGEPADADRIFNGAIDNASGVAGTLAIARALVRAGTVPRRSIYVVFTTAEESQQLGSEYLAGQLALPVDAWAGDVNIDELNVFGRARDLVLIGSERSSMFAVASSVAAGMNRIIVPDPEPSLGNFFRSDHFPLAKVGIPAVSIGLPMQFIGPDREVASARRDAFNEQDYHQTSDEMRDDWNLEGAVDDLRLLARLVWRLANNAEMPEYHAGDPLARLRK